jgi:hypothetical protein
MENANKKYTLNEFFHGLCPHTGNAPADNEMTVGEKLKKDDS